jgi:phage tail tape-measure protein
MADNRAGEVAGNIAGGLVGGGLIGMLDGPSPILDIVGSNIGSAIGGAIGGKMPGGKKRMAGQIDPRLLMMSMNMSAPNPNTDAFMSGMQQTHSY